ncbi:SatD family protein [uncultured Roseivirga sp.]|uniref:SatD family protein n=1 Tax=uncultured Roseivirga sp. TaxID=543088 RepID=UPI0030D89018|tara:strand:- start:199635 stop:200297 length:663 start_codon:yes stop_codon:yes gene_type:complete
MKIVTAVITGDIIRSTDIEGDYREVLHRIANDIRDQIDQHFLLDVYRGDSFQAISKKPEQGLLMLLLIKAGLKREQTEKNKQTIQWDARMSMGIGKLANYPEYNNLSELSGEPFTRSGRSLDSMKEKNKEITIVTGEEEQDNELKAILPMVEAIVAKWTTAQASAVYLFLLYKDITQKEIGDRLGKTQVAVSKSLDISRIDALIPYIERFETQIQWTHQK